MIGRNSVALAESEPGEALEAISSRRKVEAAVLGVAHGVVTTSKADQSSLNL